MTAVQGPAATKLLWVATTAFLLVVGLAELMPATVYYALSTVIQLVFVAVHAIPRYGWRGIVTFFVVSIVISNLLENLSIKTGFPFGWYHYTDGLGPKLFLVPIIIGPVYAATGYLAWTIGTILLGDVRRGSSWLTTIGTPVVASFAMVLWDLAIDPTQSTINENWIWHHSGGYFGVPLVNFLGWSLCVYLFFQVFALYLRRRSPQTLSAPSPSKGYLVAAVLGYGVLAWRFVNVYLVAEHKTVTDQLGQTWRTADIYETSVITMIYGMGFLTILALLKIAQRSRR
ncbi:carotenoid biosynthesis protein [Kribbella sp. NPDC051770]|uniref:carotenoid biosynthesis protein n=1 Tax=Kribbella sp. NPDC051770 TaxID=3155413 RepID=UPI00341C5090